MQQALAEPRRRAYLQALGLDLLWSREVLPGAAASEPWQAPVNEPAAVVSPSAAVAHVPSPITTSTAEPVALPDAARAAREALRTSAPATASATVFAQRVPEPAAVDTSPMAHAAPTTARFSLTLIALNATELALVDLDNMPALEGAEAQLWQAICRAYGWQAQANHAAQFHWPIPGLAATTTAAREALAGWLATQCPESKTHVVFGEALSQFVSLPHQCFPSLSTLLAEPMRKKALMMTLAETRG